MRLGCRRVFLSSVQACASKVIYAVQSFVSGIWLYLGYSMHLHHGSCGLLLNGGEWCIAYTKRHQNSGRDSYCCTELRRIGSGSRPSWIMVQRSKLIVDSDGFNGIIVQPYTLRQKVSPSFPYGSTRCENADTKYNADLAGPPDDGLFKREPPRSHIPWLSHSTVCEFVQFVINLLVGSPCEPTSVCQGIRTLVGAFI